MTKAYTIEQIESAMGTISDKTPFGRGVIGHLQSLPPIDLYTKEEAYDLADAYKIHCEEFGWKEINIFFEKWYNPAPQQEWIPFVYDEWLANGGNLSEIKVNTEYSSGKEFIELHLMKNGNYPLIAEWDTGSVTHSLKNFDSAF